MRLVPIECIRENSILGKTIYDEEGRILLQAGTKLSKSVLRKMVSIKIFSAYIDDTYTEQEIEEIIRPEIRKKIVLSIKETFSNIERINTKEDKGPESYWRKKNRKYFHSISELVNELLDEILNNKNVLCSLVDLKSMNNYIYEHIINVTVISIVMGISLKFNKQELYNLAMGALVHDIGKVFIPKELSNYRVEFTEKQKEIYRQHCLKGYEYVKDRLGLSNESALPALQHHENQDGTGYPSGLLGKNIHLYSKIVSIANCYDKLTSNVFGQKELSPNDAIEYIMSESDKMFDYNLVNVFSHVVIPYPKGTMVRLNTDEIAIVRSTPANYPLRPRIQIIKSKNESRQGNIIDLIKDLSLVIIHIEEYGLYNT